MTRRTLSGSFAVGCGFAVTMLVACGAVQWQQPPSWTLRGDGKIRASQRKEEFTLAEFLAKIKKEENKDYSIVVTPAGAKALADELSRRNAKIIELENRIRNGCQ